MWLLLWRSVLKERKFGGERTKINFYPVSLNPIILWSVQKYLDGLRMSLEWQVFIRSASTSKAGLTGLSVSDILDRGSLSITSNWQRFYNIQVESSAEKYQNKVLS